MIKEHGYNSTACTCLHLYICKPHFLIWFKSFHTSESQWKVQALILFIGCHSFTYDNQSQRHFTHLQNGDHKPDLSNSQDCWKDTYGKYVWEHLEFRRCHPITWHYLFWYRFVFGTPIRVSKSISNLFEACNWYVIIRSLHCSKEIGSRYQVSVVGHKPPPHPWLSHII